MTELPHLNAGLNSLCGVLLCCGFWAIRKGKVGAHKSFMLAAFSTSTVFLVSYLVYHYNVGHTVYAREGWLRAVYLIILCSHIVLAVVTVPLVLVTLTLALRKRFDQHRRIARWTFPIWMYVSVTGVLVYLMLYHF